MSFSWRTGGSRESPSSFPGFPCLARTLEGIPSFRNPPALLHPPGGGGCSHACKGNAVGLPQSERYFIAAPRTCENVHTFRCPYGDIVR